MPSARVPAKPCAMTTQGNGPSAPSGTYSQAAHRWPPELKVMSWRPMAGPILTGIARKPVPGIRLVGAETGRGAIRRLRGVAGGRIRVGQDRDDLIDARHLDHLGR